MTKIESSAMSLYPQNLLPMPYIRFSLQTDTYPPTTKVAHRTTVLNRVILYISEGDKLRRTEYMSDVNALFCKTIVEALPYRGKNQNTGDSCRDQIRQCCRQVHYQDKTRNRHYASRHSEHKSGAMGFFIYAILLHGLLSPVIISTSQKHAKAPTPLPLTAIRQFCERVNITKKVLAALSFCLMPSSSTSAVAVHSFFGWSDSDGAVSGLASG